MKLFLQIVVVFIFINYVSCRKPVKGCTDVFSENFNVDADEDDGSCSYRGSAVFYHNQQTSQNLIAAGVTNVKLFVNDVFFDAMSPNIYFSIEPTCSHSDAMLINNYGTGNEKNKSFNYKIKDQNNVVLASGIFQILANKCNAIKYSY
ncbi:MAG: hypothetical protein ACPGVD_10800 [Flavobacteriales bacterium]